MRIFLVMVLVGSAVAAGCSGASDEEKFRSAFEKNFSDAPWYPHISEMEVVPDGWLDITTDLDLSANVTTRTICGAASRLALDLGMLGNGISGVRMVGPGGAEQGGCA